MAYRLDARCIRCLRSFLIIKTIWPKSHLAWDLQSVAPGFQNMGGKTGLRKM